MAPVAIRCRQPAFYPIGFRKFPNVKLGKQLEPLVGRAVARLAWAAKIGTAPDAPSGHYVRFRAAIDPECPSPKTVGEKAGQNTPASGWIPRFSGKWGRLPDTARWAVGSGSAGVRFFPEKHQRSDGEWRRTTSPFANVPSTSDEDPCRDPSGKRKWENKLTTPPALTDRHARPSR